jgi:hypothetical protein
MPQSGSEDLFAMRPLLIIMAILLGSAAPSASVTAHVQDDMLCWEPDIEYPVPCDDDDDD